MTAARGFETLKLDEIERHACPSCGNPDLKPLGEGEYLLEVFLLSGKDSLPTFVKPSQNLPNQPAGA